MTAQRRITPPQIDQFSRRNAIINGNFDFWQRGTSFVINEGVTDYTADRWLLTSGDHTSFTGNITREEFSTGQTDVPNRPIYFLRADVTAASGSVLAWQVIQRIENVLTFSGSDVVLSFYAQMDSPTTVGIRIIHVYNNPGSPQANTIIDEDISVGTSWQQFVISTELPFFSLPTGPGKDFVQIDFSFPPNIPHRFDLSQVQFELGKAPSAFERRPWGEELALCQRYYHKTYQLDVDPGTPNQENTGHPHMFSPDDSVDQSYVAGAIRFPVVMRDTPSVTLYRPSTGDVNIMETVVETTGSPERTVNVSSVERGPEGMTVFSTPDGALQAATAYQFHYTADAEL